MTNHKLGKLNHLKKLCTDNNHFQMLAVDQRPPIFNLISAANNGQYTYQQVVQNVIEVGVLDKIINKKHMTDEINKEKTKMLQVPVTEKEFEILKKMADNQKRSLPNAIKIILEPYLELLKNKD